MDLSANGFDASSSHREKIFLLLSFVVLPLLGCLFLIFQQIDRNVETQRGTIRTLLEYRTGHFLKASTPKNVLRKIFRGWAKKGPKAFQGFLYSLEKRFPGAFKLIAWDRTGAIVPFEGPILSGRRMWQQIIPRFFLPEKSPGISPNQLSSDASVRSLQIFLGKKTELAGVLSLRNDVIDSVWLEKPCLLFQYSSASIPSSREKIAGAFVIVRHHSLPAGFWEYAVLKMWKQEFADHETVAFALDVSNPQRCLHDGRLPLNPFFPKDFLNRYLKRSEELFGIGSWLAMEVKTPISQIRRVFLLADFSSAVRQGVEQKLWWRGLALLFLLVFTGFAYGFGITWPWVVSFRWKIAAWFSFALVLPIAGFIFLGYTLFATERVKCHQEVSEQMRLFASRLSERLPIFCDHYGKAIHRALLKANGNNPDPWLPLIHGMVQRGTLSSYYLTDTAGRVTTFFDPQRGPHGSKPLRLAVERTFSENKLQYVSSSTANLLHAQNLQHSLLGAVDTQFMTVDIVMQGQYRALLLEVAPEILERKFVTWEIRRQGLAGGAKPGKYSSVRWEFVSGSESIPPHSLVLSALRHVAGFSGFAGSQAFEGEVVIAGIPLYLYSPVLSAQTCPVTLTSFRPLILFPQKPWSERLAHRRQQIVMAAGISLGLSLLLGLLLATSLLEPMRTLSGALREIRSGNLLRRLPEQGDNEIGRLHQSYNAMAQGLLERSRMRAFVSSSVLAAVRQETPESSHTGEIRTVAVLFSHIKDFHTLSKMASPQEVFVILNEFLAGADECIRAFGGEVDKFIGDAVMATFSGDHREIAAVKAALALSDFVATWNQARQMTGLWTIAIGIGINTGQVIMGDLGSSRRKDLTVIGDTVNLAARLESVSANGRVTHIILSASTCSPIDHLIVVEKLSITRVKGKAEPLAMYELVGIKA